MSQSNGSIRIGQFVVDTSQVLGKGATGYVYKGFHSQTSECVAVKAIQMSQITNQVTKYLLEGQIKAMSTIKSPYVVKTFDIVQQKDCCYIVMEQCLGGTLRDYIKTKGRLSSQEALQMFKKIVLGYIAIVDSLFIHRDLKTANILLRQNGDPVIIDFGYCQMIMGQRPMIQYNVGSPSYMAPQAYSKSRYSQKSDIWSLGTILYQMLTGTTLDNGSNIKEFFKMVQAQGRVRINMNGMNPTCAELFEGIFQVQPEKRATIHKLKYIIDKSMIPLMKAQLNKNMMMDSSKHSDRGQLRFVPPGYFNYAQKRVNTIAQKKQKIMNNLTVISDKHPKGINPQFWSSRDTQRVHPNQNSFNTAVGKPPSSLMTAPLQTMPPYNHFIRRSVQKHVPQRTMRKIMSVKEVQTHSSFKKIPMMNKAISMQPSSLTNSPVPNSYHSRPGIVSLRIV